MLYGPSKGIAPYVQSIPQWTKKEVLCENKMTIQGKGSVRVKPDIATMTFGVITENQELRIAQEENATRSTQVLNTLRSMGIQEKDIQTTAYNIEPMYDYVEGRQIFRGYRVSNNIRVTIRDLKKVGEVIDAAVGSGANLAENINFTLSNPSLFYRQALKLAVMDAIEKAKEMERWLGIRVNAVPFNIVEESRDHGPVAERRLMDASFASTPIMEGQIEIAANILAVFAYASR